MDYPSPRGVHVPEAYYASDPDDPYYRPPSHRNRHGRATQQTPRVRRDVTWISSPDPTPQTPRAPPSPWLPPRPHSPAPRPPSAIPPSPAPTVGEHMTVDEIMDYVIEPYPRPQRTGLFQSFWNGLKKLSGIHAGPSFPVPRPSSYVRQTAAMPVPHPSVPSEATQYVVATSSGTGSGSGSGSEEQPQRSATPYARPASVAATPGVLPATLRASPVPAPSMDMPLSIRVVSPSTSPSPRPASIRSVRMPTPGPGPRTLSVPGDPAASAEDGSQTLHEPVRPEPVVAIPIPISPEEPKRTFPLPRDDGGGGGGGGGGGIPPASHFKPQPQVQFSPGASSKGSLASTMARMRRFVADLDKLPWVWDEPIAEEYVPERNPRSRLRRRMRQGAEPSWYNARPEVVQQPVYWSEWDGWAKQSTAALWEGGTQGRVGWAGVGAGGGLGAVYPHGYVPVQPGLGYNPPTAP